LVVSLVSKIADEMVLEIGIEGIGSSKRFGKGHLIAAELRRSK